MYLPSQEQHEEKLKGFVDITEKQLNYIYMYRHDHNFLAQIQCFDMILLIKAGMSITIEYFLINKLNIIC